MKKSLLIIFLLIFCLSLQAQKDSVNIAASPQQKDISRYSMAVVSIYPVPVKDDSFTIRADRDISFVKVTNIIGQDVFRVKYNNSQELIKIFLESPKRGMYLVTIIFNDGTRVVKKIMVEQSE
jgi:hypothetical protein